MWNRIGLALGAGLASALLFAVTVQGTAIAMALAYLAPLPIMIATLGWGADVGLIALFVACATVAGVIEPLSGLLYGLTVALPALVLAALARAPSLPRFRKPDAAAPPLRASVGAMTLAAAGFGVVISFGALVTLIVVYGGYENGVTTISEMLRPTLQEAMGEASDATLAEAISLFVKYSPAAVAASTTLMLLANLYAAARSIQVSQRLDRPWPPLPISLSLPPGAALAALVALGAWLTTPPRYGAFAAVLVGALGVIFVMQGLAVLHALSRRLPARPALLFCLYFACFVAPRWVLPALAMIGAAESLYSLRLRAALRRSHT